MLKEIISRPCSDIMPMIRGELHEDPHYAHYRGHDGRVQVQNFVLHVYHACGILLGRNSHPYNARDVKKNEKNSSRGYHYPHHSRDASCDSHHTRVLTCVVCVCLLWGSLGRSRP